MKQAILNNWTLMRALRVVIGLVIIIEAIQRNDGISITVGSVFTGMAVFNIGCCGSRACAAPVKTKADVNNDVHYEEVI